MVDVRLEAVPVAEIDEGIFKYVLMKVYGKENDEGVEPEKTIVRGYLDATWHSDVYDRARVAILGLGLDTECVGGGRIEHNPMLKQIKIYGYSQGYGKADHAITHDVLAQVYPDYAIEISDEGY